MSAVSVSSLSTSDMAFNRRVKPLPKRRRASFPSSDDDDRGSPANTFNTPSRYHSLNIANNLTDKPKGKAHAAPSHTRLITKPSSFPSRPRITDDADGEGDYTDHLQQPNNTKKRKVPAATVAPVSNERTVRQDHDDLDDENAPKSQMNLSGKAFGGAGPDLDPRESDFQLATVPRRKPRSSITLATLRLKELFNTRLTMMAATIRDDVSPLALQFALSAPFARPPVKQLLRAWSYGPKFRRRPRNRVSSIPQRETCFSSQFTFSVPSPISKRYIAAKKVAAGLKMRFQTELARQATSAAEVALKTVPKPLSDPSGRERTIAESGLVSAPSNGPSTDKVVKKSNKSKKKKRSALANASNPHHLRNYVPSRVSQGGHSAPTIHNQSQANNSLGPLALKFLSATLPPRRKGRASGADILGSSLVRPENEWICPFCEYSLFYGSDDAMRRAVKNRRRALARRRKARERAAAAASGVAPQSQDVSEDDAESDEDEGEGDDSFDEDNNAVPTFTTPRGGIGTVGARQGTHGSHPGG